MTCVITQEGLPELINLLLHYKEEGKALYPEIYIFDDLPLIKKILPACDHCFVGSGQKTVDTMLKALKKCAPLAEAGWVIYILRTPTTFEYGLLRAGDSLLSVPISDLLMEDSNDGLKVILVHQISEKLIEVKSMRSDTLLISFGGRENVNSSPAYQQSKFIETIAEGVDAESRDSVLTFYKKVFMQVLQKGHGTLACVIDHTKKIPKKLSDGILLEQRISIEEIVKEIKENGDLRANSKLEGAFALIVGMMQSDGITVFTDRGEIALYNVFVKHPEKIVKVKTNGGARSRTYLTLCDYVGKGLKSAYIQSQDGKIEFKDGK